MDIRQAAAALGRGDVVENAVAKNQIERLSGKKLALRQRPPRKGDVRHTHADISLAKKLLGYKPKVKFEEGLKRTIACSWWRSWGAMRVYSAEQRYSLRC